MRPDICVVPLEAVESVLVDDVALRVLCLIASTALPSTPVEWYCTLSERLPYERDVIGAALDRLIDAGFLGKCWNETYEVRLERPDDWIMPKPPGRAEPVVETIVTEVVRSTRKRNGISVSTRYRILKRDNFKCVYCGVSASDAPLEIDHFNPVSGGGSDTDDNLRSACHDCNAGKGASAP